MKQSRLESLIEALFATAIGFVLNYAVSLYLYPAFGWKPGALNNFYIVCCFTVVSIVRGYVVRRWFNNGLHQAAVALARRLAA